MSLRWWRILRAFNSARNGSRAAPDHNVFNHPRRGGAPGFHEEGKLANPQLQERFDTNLVNFMDFVEAAKHYPCVKRAWVEYLGEHPDPRLDRVE